jgi:hypothetical protein
LGTFATKTCKSTKCSFEPYNTNFMTYTDTCMCMTYVGIHFSCEVIC